MIKRKKHNLNDSENSSSSRRKRKSKLNGFSKLSKLKKVLLVTFIIILILGSLSSYLLFSNLFKKDNSNVYSNKITDKEKKINKSNDHLEVETDTKNILLVGVDKRENEDTGRTDSIMIATIDPKNNNVKLTSLGSPLATIQLTITFSDGMAVLKNW